MRAFLYLIYFFKEVKLMKKLKNIAIVLAILVSFGLINHRSEAVNPDPNWDISGDWVINFAGGTENREFRGLVQDEYGNVTGTFWWDDDLDTSTPMVYGGTLVGYVSGNDLYFDYDRDPINYTGYFIGTIDKYGMSGTFDASSGFHCEWSVEGSPELLYEARITGGGQIVQDTGETSKNGKAINYKISFGGGSYIVNGDYWLDGLEVTFHNVSDEEIIGGKFYATSLTNMNFNFSEGVANYTLLGTFNEESGYKMIVRVQDSGEPGGEDNIRFELYEGASKIYDSYGSGDFTGESSIDGTARTYLDKGNIQVEDLR